MKKRMTDKIFRAVFTCLIIGSVLSSLTLVTSASTFSSHEIPLSPYYRQSNEDWWQYQFDGYPDYTNHNCGPASAAMVINYLKGKGVTTTHHELISPDYPSVHCYARWNYCIGNGHPNGFYNSDWSSPGATSTQIQNALSIESIQSHTFTGYDCKNDGTGLSNLQNAIDQDKVCIVKVVIHEYQLEKDYDGSWEEWKINHPDWKLKTHWVVAYGYDDDYIYLNDPGYSKEIRLGAGYRSPKSQFAGAMWDMDELSTVIVIDTAPPSTNVAEIIIREVINCCSYGIIACTCSGVLR